MKHNTDSDLVKFNWRGFCLPLTCSLIHTRVMYPDPSLSFLRSSGLGMSFGEWLIMENKEPGNQCKLMQLVFHVNLIEFWNTNMNKVIK